MSVSKTKMSVKKASIVFMSKTRMSVKKTSCLYTKRIGQKGNRQRSSSKASGEKVKLGEVALRLEQFTLQKDDQPVPRAEAAQVPRGSLTHASDQVNGRGTAS